MKFHCGFCNIDVEANPRITMSNANPPRKNGTTPVTCPKCANFIPINPERNRGSHGKGNLR